jgi:hypothetical protein
MMRLTSLLALVLLIAACNSPDRDSRYEATGTDAYADYERYGEETLISETVSADDVAGEGSDYLGREVAIEGTISEVCQNKGCWFVFQATDDAVIRVHVPKDDDDEYVFTLPMEASGRHAVAHGTLEARELTVEEQEHYAGESESGEAAHVEYRLVARSVLLSPTA